MINEEIPREGQFMLAKGSKKKSEPVGLDEALEMAKEQGKDLVLLHSTEEQVHYLRILDYQEELQRTVKKLQDAEVASRMAKKQNADKLKPTDVLEKMNLRIDKSGAEMKANLAKKQFLKGRHVMFQILASRSEDSQLALEKLGYVRDFIEREFPDVAHCITEPEVFRKRALIEFAPADSLIEAKRERERAKKAAARKKNEEASKHRRQQRQASGKKKKKRGPVIDVRNKPYEGQRFKVNDF